MIFITGDTHGGDVLLGRLYSVKHRKDFNASNENALLITGDAGIIWSASSYEKDILGQIDGVLERTLPQGHNAVTACQGIVRGHHMF